MPRRKNDFYETPPHYLAALEKLGLPIVSSDTVLEPCAGGGAITEWLLRTYDCEVVTNDIDPKMNTDWHWDAAASQKLCGHRRLWTITNPPFSLAFEILNNLFEADRNYIFLARISFNEPTKQRGDWLNCYPPKFILFLPRYSFRLNDQGKRQTDSVTCCWMGWGPDVPEGIFYSTERE